MKKIVVWVVLSTMMLAGFGSALSVADIQHAATNEIQEKGRGNLQNTTLNLSIRSGVKVPYLWITNTGKVAAVEVNWSLHITGNGFMRKINISGSGSISVITRWRAARVPLPSIGFGKVHIIAKAHARNAKEVTLIVDGVIAGGSFTPG